jgi:hypothetical protein
MYQKKRKRKIEIAKTTGRIDQKHHENSIGSIVAGDSYNYKDIITRYYVFIYMKKELCRMYNRQRGHDY